MNIPINITEKRSIGTFIGARWKTRDRGAVRGTDSRRVENAGSGGKCLVQAGNSISFFVKIRTFLANMGGENFVS